MKAAAACFLLSAALPVSASAFAHDATIDGHHERTISAASQLVPWCRAEAEAVVIARGATPYQWTASYHDRGNMLHVDGTLRVDGDVVAVRCRIARGAREDYASIEFVPRDA